MFLNPLSFGITVIHNGSTAKALTKYIDICALCGDKLEKKEDRTFDHFLPTGEGGDTKFKNGIVLCENCNSIVKAGEHPSILFEEHPEMEGKLVTYLQKPAVKDIVLPKEKKNDPHKFYVDEFRAYAEQILGRPLKG